MNTSASFWIETLGLVAHPEGGWYRETYRSSGTVATPTGERSHSTAIYYLLRSAEVSTLHRLRSDELFHHHDGSSLTVHTLDADGTYRSVRLGLDAARGDRPQAVISAGTWFGATVDAPDSFALVGCTVAPGFDFEDFEQAERGRLLELFPRHRAVIERLTRQV